MSRAKCIFLTGLPCSGKTTLANEIKKYFPRVEMLDGDVIRGTHLAKHVGFTPEDRKNHILRMGQIASMLVKHDVYAVCSFVSPSREVRDEVRKMFKPGQFIEVFCDSPVETCIERDVKGMYKKAIAGEIQNFTGIDADYEPPLKPELHLDTKALTRHHCVKAILDRVNHYDERKAVYVGRWNGALHKGHEAIFNQSLEAGKKVLLLIRDVKPDDGNPWTASEVKEMLDYRYAGDDRVESMIIPDIASVNYGRGVGYEVNEIKVTEQIAGISGTKCRQLIANNDPEWKEYVDPKVAEFLEKKYAVESKDK